MSMHKKPLTRLEEIGMLAHGLGEDIGVPSQGADLFRLGIEWALMSQADRDASVKKMIEHGLPVDTDLRQRLTDLQASQETDQGDCCCGETEEAWRLCPTHGPKENVFSDNGADIEKRMEEHADISCPACGGSGHKDDFKPVQSLGVDSRLIHVGYTNPHQIEYAKGESGLFYPDTEHDCWIPVYMLKTHEHRLLYPVGSGVRGAKAEPLQSLDGEAEFNGWYCEHCQRGVDSSEVTFNEQHEVCGRVITDDRPPNPSKGLAWPIDGVRVDGELVIVSVKGGNEIARWFCEALLLAKESWI